MTQLYDPKELNKIFEALANEHRREIVSVLSLQPASIGQLASMRKLSLPAIHKHIKILEAGDLVIRKKLGRTNFLALNRNGLQVLQNWLSQYHAYWGTNKETLENYTDYLKKSPKEKK